RQSFPAFLTAKTCFFGCMSSSTSVLSSLRTAGAEKRMSPWPKVTVIRSVLSKNCERAISYPRRSNSPDFTST
ncbi:hypothetical protein NE604_08775, partial [Anaerofustis stercorihominis]|uniref:hypothetical protein n=1 Tax=Anaerofustis stercorihominis TaxID=214853 RepID=UPI00210BA4C1